MNAHAQPQRRDSSLSFLHKAGKRLSFKNEAEQPPPPPKPVLKEAYFPTYEFSWEKLKAYLEWKFPNTKFGDRNVNVDKYVFAIPIDAELDEDEIAEWRDAEDTSCMTTRMIKYGLS